MLKPLAILVYFAPNQLTGKNNHTYIHTNSLSDKHAPPRKSNGDDMDVWFLPRLVISFCHKSRKEIVYHSWKLLEYTQSQVRRGATKLDIDYLQAGWWESAAPEGVNAERRRSEASWVKARSVYKYIVHAAVTSCRNERTYFGVRKKSIWVCPII